METPYAPRSQMLLAWAGCTLFFLTICVWTWDARPLTNAVGVMVNGGAMFACLALVVTGFSTLIMKRCVYPPDIFRMACWVTFSLCAGIKATVPSPYTLTKISGLNASDVEFVQLVTSIGMLVSILAIPASMIFFRFPDVPMPYECQNCGYNLTGNVSGICPECGVRI